MLRAAIDIGSNSVRLLVAGVTGGEFQPLFRLLDTTRLHDGLDAQGNLSAESMARTAGAIAGFALKAREAGVRDEDIFAFATSAVRDAANGRDFMAAVKADCGVDIKLLTGEQEAAYAFYAAARPGECGVVDIGGASTEMICGCDGRVRASYSAQMGAVRLRRMLGEGASVERMLEQSAAVLEPGIRALGALPEHFVGVAGTITTLCALDMELKEYSPERINGAWLSRESAERWLKRLVPMSIADRRALPGMPARRAEIIDYGAAIVVSFLRLTGLCGLYVSDRDNLYTAIMRPDKADSGENNS